MHPTVYDWFKDHMQQMVGPDVPFHETQGQLLVQKNLPDMWMTMETDTTSMNRITIGSPAIYREAGSVSCVYLIKSGRGFADSLVAAQRLADDMRDNHYQTELTEVDGRAGTLRLENISSPDPAPYEDGNWLLCSVICAYTYDSVRGPSYSTP